MRRFTEEFETINKPGQIRSDCNSIAIINTGANPFLIESAYELAPGAQYYAPGNADEFNIKAYTIAPVTPGANIQAVVIRKTYLNY